MVLSQLSSIWRQMKRKKVFNENVMNTHFNRCLSTVDLTFMGIGQMLGAGIYVITGTIIRNKTGPAIFISYTLAGITAFLNALCYAELASRYPKAGSAYTYTYVASGELIGFIIGWSLILEYILSVASVARGWSSTLDVLANHTISNFSKEYLRLPDTVYLSDYPDLLAAGIILLFFLMVILGPRISNSFNIFICIINVGVICVMTVTMFIYANPATFAEKSKGGFLPYSFSGVIVGTGTCFYAYIGFDGLAVCTEEATNPKRSMPVAMALSVGTVSILLVAASLALTLFEPWYEVSPNAAFSEAFESHGMIWAKYLVGVGSLFGISASLFTAAYTLPRLVYAIANDGLLFSFFSYVLPSTQVPIWSIAVFGPICALLAVFLDIAALADFLSIGTLIAFTIVNFCILIIRYRPSLPRTTDDENRKDTSCGSLMPRFQNVPLLNSLRPGFAVKISIGVFAVFSSAAEILIVRGMHYITTWWMICLLTVFASITLISIFVMAIHIQDDNFDSYKLPGVPFVPCFCILLNEAIIFKLKTVAWVRYIIWVTIGLLIYFLYGMHHSKLRESEKETTPLVNSPSEASVLLDSTLSTKGTRSRYEKSR